ncbi:hypothetical protein ACW0S1_09840 [Fusobacterium polymorphum]
MRNFKNIMLAERISLIGISSSSQNGLVSTNFTTISTGALNKSVIKFL